MASITITIYSVSPFYDTVGLYPNIYLHSEHHPRHLLYTDSPASFPPLLPQWAHTSLLYDTVGLYPIYLLSGHHPCHLLYTVCPASLPSILAQWAHTSSFYDTVGLYSSFTYTVSSTLAIYCTQTVQPQFLPYLHSGPMPPHFMTQWAYILIQWAPASPSTVHNCIASFPPLLHQSAHTSLLYDNVGLCAPRILTQGAPPSPSTGCKLSSLSFSLTCTVGPYLLIL